MDVRRIYMETNSLQVFVSSWWTSWAVPTSGTRRGGREDGEHTHCGTTATVRLYRIVCTFTVLILLSGSCRGWCSSPVTAEWYFVSITSNNVHWVVPVSWCSVLLRSSWREPLLPADRRQQRTIHSKLHEGRLRLVRVSTHVVAALVSSLLRGVFPFMVCVWGGLLSSSLLSGLRWSCSKPSLTSSLSFIMVQCFTSLHPLTEMTPSSRCSVQEKQISFLLMMLLQPLLRYKVPLL